MSDYLSNLVNRAYGRLPILQPRRASLFEPASPIGAPDVIEEVVAPDVTGVAGPRVTSSNRRSPLAPSLHTPTAPSARRAMVGRGHPAGHEDAREVASPRSTSTPELFGDQSPTGQHAAAMPDGGPSEAGLLHEPKSPKLGSAGSAVDALPETEAQESTLQGTAAEPFELITLHETRGQVLRRAPASQSHTTPEMPHLLRKSNAPIADHLGNDAHSQTAAAWQPATRSAFANGNPDARPNALRAEASDASQAHVTPGLRWPPATTELGVENEISEIAEMWSLEADVVAPDGAPLPRLMSRPTRQLSHGNIRSDAEVRPGLNRPVGDGLEQHLRVALEEAQAAPRFLRTIRASSQAIRIVPPRALPLAPAQPDAAASASVTPTIQVTIGRVEVRANTPAAAPSRKPSSGPAVMSLDDYLRARNGGSQ